MRQTDSSPQLDKKPLETIIGVAARKARNRLDLTQADVAEKLGVTREFYARIDRGHNLPSMPTFYAIAVVLEISADEMLGRVVTAPAIARSNHPQRPAGKGGAADERRELRLLHRQLRKASSKTLKIVNRLLTQIERA